MRVPEIDDALADQIARVVRSIRALELKKAPSISETIDWARTLLYLGKSEIDPDGDRRDAARAAQVPVRHHQGAQGARRSPSPRRRGRTPIDRCPARRFAARRPPGVRPRAARRRAAGVDDREPRRHARDRAHPHRRPRAVQGGARAPRSSSTSATSARSTPCSTSTSRCSATASTARTTARATPPSGDEVAMAGAGPGRRRRHRRCRREELAAMLLAALHEHGPRRAAPPRGRSRCSSSRAWSRVVPSAARTTCTARCGSSTSTTCRSGCMGQARERGEVAEDELADRLAHEEFETRLKELRELVEEEIRRRLVADRGVEAMARTLRKPLARGHRVHARVARGDARAAAGGLPADARARGAPRATAPASPPRPPRLPQDRARVAVVRRRARGAEVPQPAPVEARDHGGRRHLGVGGQLRPVHVACSCTRWRASSRRCGRGCSSTASTRSRASSRSPTTSLEAVHRVNTEADVVWVDGHSDYGHAFEVFHQRHYHGDHAEDVDHPARRRAQQLPRVAGVGRRRDAQARPPRVLARPRAARLLGHRRLDRVGVRPLLRRRLRVPQPAPAPAVRRSRSPKTADPPAHQRTGVSRCAIRRSLTPV